MSEDEIVAAAMRLDTGSRGRIADQLYESLANGPILPQWAAELNQRLDDYKAGRAETVTSNHVFRNRRKAISK